MNKNESVGTLQSDSLHAVSQTVTSPLTQDYNVPTDFYELEIIKVQEHHDAAVFSALVRNL